MQRRDKGGIFGFGILKREQREIKNDLAEEEIARGVQPHHTIVIEVNPSGYGGTYIVVARWSRTHEPQLIKAITEAVKNLGFPGKVRVKVSY